MTDILHRNKATIISISSYTGNSSDNDGRGVFGYRSDNFYKNELSILSKSSWYRGELTNGTSINWTNNINNLPSLRTFQFKRVKKFGGGDVFLKTYNNLTLDSSLSFYVTSGSGRFADTGNKMFGIGEIPNAHYYQGFIGEAIVFASALNDEELNRVHSNLSIKYGQPLRSVSNTVNYKASNGANIWQADSKYQNNIIGIGRDDISLLNQKQSHQMDDVVRLYHDKIHTTNQENNGTFSKDRSFVLMGSNEVKLHATDASNTEMFAGLVYSTSCHLFSVIERNWKVQPTNMTDRFNIDIRLSDSVKLHQINPAHLRLVVDNDNDLSNGWIGCYGINDDGLNIVYANRLFISQTPL